MRFLASLGFRADLFFFFFLGGGGGRRRPALPKSPSLKLQMLEGASRVYKV